MKRKAFISIFLVGFLITSILTADLSRGIIVSDQLALNNGAYVEGKLFYTNATVTDALVAYPTIKVENIYTPSDIPNKVIQILYSLDLTPGTIQYIDMMENEEKIEFTHLVFYDNRTTFMIGRLYMQNATESVEISVLDQTTYAGLTNLNNTKITYKNGTTYTYGNVLPNDAVYPLIADVMLAFALLSYAFTLIYAWTILGISPTANVGDNINHVYVLGDVIDKPAVITSEGESYDSIHVLYQDSSLFGMWNAPELHIYYEASTGLVLRVVETDDVKTWEFVPGAVKLTSGIPFSTVGIVLGIAAIGLIAVIRRKKK